MTRKNSLKEYWLLFLFLAIFCGLLKGIIAGLLQEHSVHGIFSGILSGFLFGGIYTIATAMEAYIAEKKSKKLREDISRDKKIICESPANQEKGVFEIGGQLFLCEDTVEFYPHKMKSSEDNVSISIDDIVNVDSKADILIIQAKNEIFRFQLNKTVFWETTIAQII